MADIQIRVIGDRLAVTGRLHGAPRMTVLAPASVEGLSSEPAEAGLRLSAQHDGEVLALADGLTADQAQAVLVRLGRALEGMAAPPAVTAPAALTHRPRGGVWPVVLTLVVGVALGAGSVLGAVRHLLPAADQRIEALAAMVPPPAAPATVAAALPGAQAAAGPAAGLGDPQSMGLLMQLLSQGQDQAPGGPAPASSAPTAALSGAAAASAPVSAPEAVPTENERAQRLQEIASEGDALSPDQLDAFLSIMDQELPGVLPEDLQSSLEAERAADPTPVPLATPRLGSQASPEPTATRRPVTGFGSFGLGRPAEDAEADGEDRTVAPDDDPFSGGLPPINLD